MQRPGAFRSQHVAIVKSSYGGGLGLELAHAGITAAAALLASYVGAKWAESRKLQARFEKLDHIREEMREVTRVQEDIKRQLQGGEWNRQTLWRQRLEAYTQLLRVSTDYLGLCYTAPENSDELRKLRADTFKAMTVVEIFADDEVLKALRQFFASSAAATGQDGGASPASPAGEIEALRQLQTLFIAAAREQLKSAIES